MDATDNLPARRESEPAAQRFFTPIFGVVLVVSLILNVLLARTNSQLRAEMDESLARSPVPVGTEVPFLELKTLDGADVVVPVRTDDRATVLYIFSPDCGWCDRNLENQKGLIASLDQSKYRFIGMSGTAENLAGYLAEKAVDAEIFSTPSAATKELLKLGMTPTTIVLSPEGKVARSWTGAYSPRVQKEIEEYFGLTLPGLAEGS